MTQEKELKRSKLCLSCALELISRRVEIIRGLKRLPRRILDVAQVKEKKVSDQSEISHQEPKSRMPGAMESSSICCSLLPGLRVWNTFQHMFRFTFLFGSSPLRGRLWGSLAEAGCICFPPHNSLLTLAWYFFVVAALCWKGRKKNRRREFLLRLRIGIFSFNVILLSTVRSEAAIDKVDLETFWNTKCCPSETQLKRLSDDFINSFYAIILHLPAKATPHDGFKLPASSFSLHHTHDINSINFSFSSNIWSVWARDAQLKFNKFWNTFSSSIMQTKKLSSLTHGRAAFTLRGLSKRHRALALGDIVG